MRIAAVVVLVLVLVGGLSVMGHTWLGGGEDTAATVDAQDLPATQVVIPVEGMTCSGCAVSVKMALKKLEGVQGASVDVGKGEAAVTYIGSKVTVEQIIEAINSTGFTARKPSAG